MPLQQASNSGVIIGENSVVIEAQATLGPQGNQLRAICDDKPI